MVFAVYVILDAFKHEKLFKWSNENLSLPLVKTQNAALTIFFKIVTNSVNPQLAAVLLIICVIIARDKLRMVNIMMYIMSCTYIMICLKALYRDPRPYMVDKRIEPLEKYADYGNPSGQVFIGYLLTAVFMESFVYAEDMWIEKTKTKGSEVGKLFLHFVLVALIFMSRIYLEMHALNQASLSLVLGIYTHMLYNTIFKK